MTETPVRMARCTYFKTCGSEVTSEVARTDRAFFQNQDADSRDAKIVCKHCRYHDVAHEREKADRRPGSRVCDNFEPRGAAEYDEYYCGCHGWE